MMITINLSPIIYWNMVVLIISDSSSVKIAAANIDYKGHLTYACISALLTENHTLTNATVV